MIRFGKYGTRPERVSAALSPVLLLLSFCAPSALAEGSAQFGLLQHLLDADESEARNYATDEQSSSLYVDIVSAGEVINISLCGNANTDDLRVEVFSPSNYFSPQNTYNLNDANVDCAHTMDSTLSTPLRHVSSETGTYKIRLHNQTGTDFGTNLFRRFDITVTPNSTIDPDPTESQGRLWAYTYGFNAGSFSQTNATDVNLFVLIPGGRPNSNYVWELDLSNFAGYGYNLVANSLGVSAPNSGYSTPVAGNSVSYEHPIYIGKPAIAFDNPIDAPVVNNIFFLDDEGVDHTISPTTSLGTQDVGSFHFFSDVAGTYSIRIDANRDNEYGNAGDAVLVGEAAVGLNTVLWDGNNAIGMPMADGTYNAELLINLGEYHFVANDVETSGGPAGGGITIYLVDKNGLRVPTQVYWDDISVLGASVGGTSNTPDGALSGTVDGTHTWGDFTTSGFGNERLIDTYVYGLSTTSYASVAITSDNSPVVNHDAVLDVGSIVPGNSIAIQVADVDLNVDPTALDTTSVEATNFNTGEVEVVDLVETGVNTGVFTTSVPTFNSMTAGTDNDGTLHFSSDHSVSVVYIDWLSSTGESVVNTENTDLTLDSDTDGMADYLDTDDDNDGISDLDEGVIDTDGDGLEDRLDNDSDNDGIPDTIESGRDYGSVKTPVDTDMDGIPDYRDLDSDNDGIEDATEAPYSGVDTDADGIDDSVDVDVTGGTDLNMDGVDDAASMIETNDTDGDNIPDYLDTDSDNDGIDDTIEANGSGNLDIDGDGVPNHLDTDSDNDGIDDSDEHNAIGILDVDGDGIPNYLDTDSDNDGIDDSDEHNAIGILDVDGDGIPNYLDTDSDNDGIDDSDEHNAIGNLDVDGDGMPNYLDTDSDNDGQSDAVELGVRLDGEPADTDGDGTPDYADTDADNDGLPDAVEYSAGSGSGSAPDSDNDGVPNALDTDSDNDGITDSIEAGLTLTDSDGDGISDAFDVDSTQGLDANGDGVDDAVTLPDTDGDGHANWLDLDSDGDGVDDSAEGIADSNADGIPDLLQFGIDGSSASPDLGSGSQPFSESVVDSDNDGISDVAEGSDDSDGDGVVNYLDTDSDNDGISDAVEARTDAANGSGSTNGSSTEGDAALITRFDALVDSDGDGVPDILDRDSDNDGLSDTAEVFGPSFDADGNGEIDHYFDASGDGFDDAAAAVPARISDSDSDGLGAHLDNDSDGDGILDLLEAGGIDADGDGVVDVMRDSDGDGIPNVADVDETLGADADADGIDDLLDSDFVQDAIDTDRDGIADRFDPDADGDGLVDNKAEAGIPDSGWLDIDGNGVPDVVEATDDAVGQFVRTGVGCTVGESANHGLLLTLLVSFLVIAMRRRPTLRFRSVR